MLASCPATDGRHSVFRYSINFGISVSYLNYVSIKAVADSRLKRRFAMANDQRRLAGEAGFDFESGH